jgi:hypothetical protein
MPHMAQIDVRSSTKAEGFRISMRTGTKSILYPKSTWWDPTHNKLKTVSKELLLYPAIIIIIWIVAQKEYLCTCVVSLMFSIMLEPPPPLLDSLQLHY